MVGEGALTDAQEGSQRRRAESPMRSAQSTGRVNPQAPGWTKRLRLGSTPLDRVPCPSRMSTLELSIQKYAEQPDKSVVKPKLGLSFDSLGEAYDFYNLYFWEIGKVWKKQAQRREDEKHAGDSLRLFGKTRCREQQVLQVRLPCSHQAATRSRQQLVHNRAQSKPQSFMSLTMGEKVHWPSHKHIDVYTKDLIKQLRENNVNLGKVYSIIGSFFGSVEKVPFTKRTLRNICGKISREQAEDDVRKTLQVFADIRSSDPGFSYVVLADKDSKVKNFMWANGSSRMQYRFFGDVITFDTTGQICMTCRLVYLSELTITIRVSSLLAC